MNKLSNAQIAEVLTDASATLRTQQAQITDLEEKLAAREQRDRVEKLAVAMHRKGINLDTEVNALADRLEKSAEAGKLETMEAAVELVAPDMGTKLGQVNNNDESGKASASSALEQFILGDVG